MERPADEVFHRAVPLLAVSHIEDAGLQIGNDIGTERKVLIHTAFRQAGKVGTLLDQLLGELTSRTAVDVSAGTVQPVDVRTELLVEGGIVGTIDGHLGADGTLGDGAEVDARDGAVGQHTVEVRLAFLDGGRGIPVEADAHALTDRAGADTGLPIDIAGVEGEAHNLEVGLRAGRGLERIKLVYLIHLCVKKSALCIGQSLYEGGVRHIGINLLDDQSFGSVALVLVGSLRLHFLLPLPLAL